MQDKKRYCDTESDTCKLFMNSLYGKHGQKYYKKYFMGTMDDCCDHAEFLIENDLVRDQKKIMIDFLNSDVGNLYNFKYK